MGSKFFLSHDHRDDDLAGVVASTLSRLSLGQLEVWFSSDRSPLGGMRPGSIWIDEIRAQLEQSKAILILLTPNSLNKPWLLFESGFGAAVPNCEIIPLCVGISSVNDVPFPLAMYQSYQLSGYSSLKNFVAKLLALYGINFDEEMAKPVLERAILDFTKYMHAEDENKKSSEVTLVELGNDIKQHLDRRFMQLMEREQNSSSQGENISHETQLATYSVPLYLECAGSTSTEHLEIDNVITVFDVLNNIYFMIADKVKPFTYLNSWILQEARNDLKLVIYEVSQVIPAKFIFTPESEWKVVFLSKPYSPADSADYHRWYRPTSIRRKRAL